MNAAKRISIVTVVGSSRPASYTAKAVTLVDDEIHKHQRFDLETIDLATISLPFPGAAGDDAVVKGVQEKVRRAAGVILATPEYHGSFSSAVKLFIENLGFPSGLARKPVALLGVAAGQIGAIKSLEHLRSVCSHVGAIVLPGPVSVANVQKVFDEKGNCRDEAVEKRIRGLTTSVIDYIKGYICPSVALEEMVRKKTA
jgi:FMN reductase